MITALDDLKTEQLKIDDYPFILAAGERRSYNAHQISRDPNWRKKDMEGALRIHSDDAIKIGFLNNDYALVKYVIISDETLNSIGTYIISSDATVKFEIYDNFDNKPNDPGSSTNDYGITINFGWSY